MSYSKFEIIRSLYSLEKRISSSTLKVGDRFIFPNHSSLLFKTDAVPVGGKYLCCDEEGKTKWLEGEIKVTKINGVGMELTSLSRQFKTEFLKQKMIPNKSCLKQ